MTDYTHLNDANYNCWILTKSIRSINESCVTENGSWTKLCKEDNFGEYVFSQEASYAAGSFAAIFRKKYSPKIVLAYTRQLESASIYFVTIFSGVLI